MGMYLRSGTNIADNFVNGYTEYASGITDAPVIYHEACGLFAVSSVTTKNMAIHLRRGVIYPNIWVILLGDSYKDRKSTSLNICYRILREVTTKEIAGDATPEALLAEVSRKREGYIVRDEFYGLMADTNKEYMSGFKPLLIKLHDCVERYERITMKRKFVIEQPYVTFLTATTYDGLRSVTTQEDLTTGFLSRFLIVPSIGSRGTDSGVEIETPDIKVSRYNLIETLNAIKTRCESIDGVRFNNEAGLRYMQWYERFTENLPHDPLERVLQGRSVEIVTKLAILYEIASLGSSMKDGEIFSTTLYIKEIAVNKAIEFIERVFKKDSDGKSLALSLFENPLTQRIYRIICNTGKDGILHRDAIRSSAMLTKQFRLIVDTLVESDLVKKEERKPSGAGRPGMVYKAKKWLAPEGGG